MKQKLRSSVLYELATQPKTDYGSRETNMYIKPKNFTPWYLNAALCFRENTTYSIVLMPCYVCTSFEWANYCLDAKTLQKEMIISYTQHLSCINKK